MTASTAPRPRRGVAPAWLATWPAGDVDGLAADVARGVADQEGDDLGHVSRLPHPAQGDLGRPLGLVLLEVHADPLGGGAGHARLDESRRHGVDVDAERP